MKQQNRVLRESYRPVSNFFCADSILQDYIHSKLSAQGFAYMLDAWEELGTKAAQEMDSLSLQADKQGPVLRKRNFLGEDIHAIDFHPAYWQLLQIAIDSQMFRVKWQPELRSRFGEQSHSLGFVSGYLFALSELGQYCPLCMTDGVARLIDRYMPEEEAKELLEHIASDTLEGLYTGAMFLTEKAGGSDVGRNLVEAEHVEGRHYLLSGEKWFCSNANAELIFVLARTKPEKQGTRGLSIFLIQTKGGQAAKLPIVRLKDKLGVRSMASAEIVLDKTPALLVGQEFQGFKIMTEMINLSRLYNSVAALSGARRALVEAYSFLSYRESFGKLAKEHALVRDKLYELGSLYVADFYLCWRSIEALDAADAGNEQEALRIRLLTPMTKKWTAEQGVYIVRESMELMGGMGYIEDGVLPKIMRDILVLPIWEGAGNIMILDMLRATLRSPESLLCIFSDIQASVGRAAHWANFMEEQLGDLQKQARKLQKLEGEEQELLAKHFFDALTSLYQMSLLINNEQESNNKRMQIALRFLSEKLSGKKSQSLLSVEELDELIGWDLQA